MLNQRKGEAHIGGTNGPNVSMDEEYGDKYDGEDLQEIMDHEEMIKNAYMMNGAG